MSQVVRTSAGHAPGRARENFPLGFKLEDGKIVPFGPPRAADGQIIQPQTVRRIYFDPDTGFIIRDQITYEVPGEVLDTNMIEVDLDSMVSPTTYKIDLTTKQPVLMTQDDTDAQNAPDVSAVKDAVINELFSSDQTQLADAPGSTTLKAQWKTYRAALRALSGATSISAAIKAFPLRPDGTDAISEWRKYGD